MHHCSHVNSARRHVKCGLCPVHTSDCRVADPGVLEDVQRALRAKARREARLRTQSTPLRVEPPRQPDRSSISSAGSSHDKAASAVPPSPRQPRISEDSEIDFSPAVGVIPSHPVPSSLDGGVTLDWSTSGSEHGRERRWSLSRGKRRSKDLSSIPLSRAATEKQDAAYDSQCTTINQLICILTWRKRETGTDTREGQTDDLEESRHDNQTAGAEVSMASLRYCKPSCKSVERRSLVP